MYNLLYILGGTVDYTAQIAQQDEKVKEIKIANGGDWGGRHIDKRFMDLVEEILGKSVVTKLKQEHASAWYELEKKFEKAKANAKPGKGFNVPIPTMIERFVTKDLGLDITSIINANGRKYGIKENNAHFVISAECVRQLFGEILEKIGTHAKRMLDSGELKGLDIVFLVGGFGNCKLLQDHLKVNILCSYI